MVTWKESKGKWRCCHWILLGLNNQPSNHHKILWQDNFFKGTVASGKHNSWDTETKTSVFVAWLYVSNKRKMNHGSSRCVCTMQCYHWNRRRVLIGRGGTYWNVKGKSNYSRSSFSCSLSDTYSLYQIIVFFVSKTYFQLLHLHPLLNLPHPH